jgi:tetratricopeptide (TPR) repeat protein
MHNRNRLLGALMLLLAALNATSLATAQRETGAAAEPDHDADPELRDALMHFNLGVDFYREGSYRAALIEFRTAYEIRPSYKLLYNLAQASVELQEYANAVNYLLEYLDKGGTELAESRRQETQQMIQTLKSRMANISVTSNEADAEIYLDDTLVGRAPLANDVAVSVGRHRIIARKRGLPAVEGVVDVAAGERRTLHLEFVRAPQNEPRPAIGRAAPEPEPPARPLWGLPPSALWAGAATTALVLGAATMSVLTLASQNNYQAARNTLTSAAALNELRDVTEARALVSSILWGATLAGAGVTTFLIVTNDEQESIRPASARVSLSASPTHLTLEGTF